MVWSISAACVFILDKRHVRVGSMNDFAHRVDIGERIARSTERVHDLVQRQRALIVRNIHGRPKALLHSAVPRVPGHAHNLRLARSGAIPNGNALGNRIPAAEIRLGKRLVDDGHRQ